MLIKDIHIDGFGIYNDFSLTDLSNGVNIILGTNEAGKTTILKFLRYTIFGYPRLKEQRMAPLKGGSHGGKIRALLTSGNEITLDRRGSGKIKLFFSGKEYNHEGDLLQLLGNTSASLYNNVYAFTIDELVSLGSLTDSGVEDKIFSVGIGLGNISLAEIETDIRDQINDIYKNTGRNKIITEILREIGEKKSEIAEIRSLIPLRGQLMEELKVIEKKTTENEILIREKISERIRLDNILKCHDSYVKIVSSDEGLSELPPLSNYPDNGLEKLQKLEEKKQKYNESLQGLIEGTAGEKGIRELGDFCGSIIFNKNLLAEPEKVDYLKSNQSRYQNILSDIDQDDLEIYRLKNQLKGLLEGINPAWNEDDVLRIKGTEMHRSAIRAFRQELDELREKRITAEAYLSSLRVSTGNLQVSNIAAIISLILFITSIPAFYYSLSVLGGAIVIAGIIIFLGRGYIAKESPELEIGKEINDLEKRRESIMEAYRGYLEDRLGIPGSISPGAAERLLNEVDKAVGIIGQINIIEAKQNEQRKPFVREFELVARSMLPLLPDKAEEDNIEILVNSLISEFNISSQQREIKSSYEKELHRKSRELENIEKRIEETVYETESLLNYIGASDSDEFYLKYHQNNLVKKLLQEKSNALLTIDSILGPGESEWVISFLKKSGKEHIEREVEEIKFSIEDLNQIVREQRSRVGEIRNEIRRIEDNSDMAEAMTSLETAKHKLRTAVADWLSGRLALEMLAEVKTKYEKEKQPVVINNAGRYFSAVTKGRYNRLHVSMDDREVQIYDATGAFKTTGQLSRGAKEQLLLSLRLGFIEEYEKQSEPLPVVIDEVLVNFDPERAFRMAEVLFEFAKERQILMFSCHPMVVHLFEGKNINLIRL